MGERRAFVGRLTSLGRWLLLAALVGAAGVVVGRHLIQVQLDERIRTRVRALLADQFRGVEVHVQAARRIEGKGIEIRGIALDVQQDGQPSHRLVYVDELFASCKADLRDLLSGDLSVQQLSIRGMHVCAVRGRDGQWDVARLFPLPASGGSRPMVSIEGSTVEFRESGQGAESGWALRDIRVTVRPEVQGGRLVRYRLGGTMLGDHFKRVKIAGEVHPNGTWSAGGTIDGLEMSPRMQVALPSDVAAHLSFLATLRARAHFEFRLAHQQGDPEPVRWVLQGHLSEGDLDDPRLPLPLAELDADVYCDNGQLRIDGVTARSGPTSLELSCRYDEYLSDKPRLHLSARITDLSLDERLRTALPASLRPEWDKYALAGRVDAVVNLSVADGLLVPDIEVTCRDVSFAYREFPYPFQHARGVVRLKGRTLQLSDFTAEASGVAVHLAAEFHDPGPKATGWLTARSAGPVPLDETLILALNPAGQRTARMLRPAGALSLVSGRFERQVPGGPRHTRWELDLDACSVLYELFPVPIDNVTGKLIVTNGTWELQNLHGHHGSGYVTCDGSWSPASGDQKGGELTLRLQCADVPLDDTLRGAVGRINAGAEQVWADLRPRGTIDHLDAVVRYDADAKRTAVTLTGEKWGPDQNVEGRSINIHPRWLPIRLDDVTGRVTYEDGTFTLHEVSARRGDAKVELAGHGQVTPDQRWQVQVTRLIADRIRVDHELMEALPAGLRAVAKQIEYRGQIGVSGNAWLAAGNGQPVDAAWDVVLDIEDGSLDNLLKLEHIHGGVRLTGKKQATGFHSRGEVEIDSLIARGVQVTQIHGPLWLDAGQLIIGTRADAPPAGQSARPLTAQTLGGKITLDGRVVLDDQMQYAVEVSLAQGELSGIAHTTLTDRKDVSGKVFAVLQLAGARAGVHTLQGRGQVRLREADVYELPVMVNLLKFVSLQRPDRNAFTSSDVDFRISGEQIFLDRIDFHGDAISLKGQGWMDLNRRINVDFYTLVGRHEIQLPLIREFVAQASRNMLLIQVVGTIDQPRIISKPLPELDETLQRIFPEAVPHEAQPKLPWFLGRKESVQR